MKIKKFNEKNDKLLNDVIGDVSRHIKKHTHEDHFIITYHESGDEIHFILMPMSQYNYVNNALGEIQMWDQQQIETFIQTVRNNQVSDIMVQSYCNESWFSQYNILFVLHIPEFGN